MSHESESPRNSSLRVTFDKITTGVSRYLHENHPCVTPNMVTASGTGLIAGGSVAAYIGNDPDTKHPGAWRTAASAAYLVGGSTDGFDGALFRYKKKLKNEGDTTVQVEESPNFDAINDRAQEVVQGVTRIAIAQERGDKLGATLATAATVLQPIPSALRAAGEMRGRVFPENGKIPVVDIWGTRSGRAIANAVGTVFPGTVQKVADGLVVLSTARTIYQRGRTVIARDPESTLDVLPPIEKEKAKKRFKNMAGMALIGFGAAVLANYAYSKNQNKSSHN